MTWTERLGLDWPIIQAPMAGAQGSELAIAVSNAGALGSLPCAMLGPQAMREELAAIQAGIRRGNCRGARLLGRWPPLGEMRVITQDRPVRAAGRAPAPRTPNARRRASAGRRRGGR